MSMSLDEHDAKLLRYKYEWTKTRDSEAQSNLTQMGWFWLEAAAELKNFF